MDCKYYESPGFNWEEFDDMLLHLAVLRNEADEVFEFLLKYGVRVNSRANASMLNVEFPTDFEHRQHLQTSSLHENQTEFDIFKTTTSLYLAVMKVNYDKALLLLEREADINARMEGGETPLIIAVLCECLDIMKLLISYGADVNAKTIWGKSALHYAAQSGKQQILTVLLDHGGHVNVSTQDGLTPLHIAAEAGNVELVEILLNYGAGVNIKAKNGATALHYAAVMRHKAVIKLFMEHGADITLLMSNGSLDLSAFSWMTDEQVKKTQELLEKYMPKQQIYNGYNTTKVKFINWFK